MRVRFQWETEEPLKLPVGYHRILQGIIYKSLQNISEYSKFLHDEGYSYKGRQYRMFCFSDLKGENSVKQKQITFTGPLFFDVSSPDDRFIRLLSEQIRENGVNVGNQHYANIKTKLSNPEVESSNIVVKTLSPITVYETDNQTGWTRYFSPEETRFSDAINYNFQRKYEAYYGVPVRESISVEPVSVHAEDKCVTTYKGIYITGYYGVYRLKGPRKYLNFLYQTGLGAKNSQGFGMIVMKK